MVKFNNNFNKYDNKIPSFTGERKDIQSMPDEETVLKERTAQNNEMLANLSERSVPENNKFSPITVEYNLPNSRNMARVTVEYDEQMPATQRRITVGVHHKDRDRLISNYLYKGTKQEVINFLKNEKNTLRFIESIKALSAATDKYYENL